MRTLIHSGPPRPLRNKDTRYHHLLALHTPLPGYLPYGHPLHKFATSIFSRNFYKAHSSERVQNHHQLLSLLLSSYFSSYQSLTMLYNNVFLALELATFVDAFFRMSCPGRNVRERLDPIVSPGVVSGHVHTISGGAGFKASMTYGDTQASKCSSCTIKVRYPHFSYNHKTDLHYRRICRTTGLLSCMSNIRTDQALLQFLLWVTLTTPTVE